LLGNALPQRRKITVPPVRDFVQEGTEKSSSPRPGPAALKGDAAGSLKVPEATGTYGEAHDLGRHTRAAWSTSRIRLTDLGGLMHS
jgi:hypothetical protein